MEEYFKKIIIECLEPLNKRISNLENAVQNISYGKPVMNTKEVAEYLGMSKSWVDHNIDDIPCFRLGSRPMFNKEDIDKWRLSKSNTLNDRCGKVTIKPVKK